MILVLIGTQEHQFARLMVIINQIKNEEIIVQTGHTNYEFTNQNIKTFKFISNEDMENLIKKCDILITHGGVGSILSGLSANKKIIAYPRLKKYNEHVNDHQTEICDKLTKGDFIYSVADQKVDINKLIKKIKIKKFEKYQFDNSEILNDIKDNL